MDSKLITGIAWFEEKDWEEWRKISEDQIEDKFDDWLIEALLAKSKFEKEGYSVRKVIIKPNEFKKWCNDNNKKIESSSRSQYVSELLLKGNV